MNTSEQTAVRSFFDHAARAIGISFPLRRRHVQLAASELLKSAPTPPPKLKTAEEKYRDLLHHLGVQGHDGALAEIEALRRKAQEV